MTRKKSTGENTPTPAPRSTKKAEASPVEAIHVALAPAAQSETKDPLQAATVVAAKKQSLNITTPPAGKTAKHNVVPINIDEQIRRRAYEIWEERGRPRGLDRENWAMAEYEILSRHNAQRA